MPAFLGEIAGEVTPAILRQALRDTVETLLIAEHPIRENCFILARSDDELQEIIDNAIECAREHAR